MAVADIETVNGPMDVSRLGFTLMHEHLFSQSVAMRENWPETLDRSLVIGLVRSKVIAAKASGVDTIVDLTTPDIGRDVRIVAEISANTGVNVIVATGFWLTPPRYFENRSPDVGAKLLVKDITQGIQATAIKAAIIKLASNDAKIAGLLEVAFRVAARAHLETGVPISTHTNALLMAGLDQQRVLAEEGVDLSQVIIGHSGDTADTDYLKRLLDRGSYLGMDRFGLDWVGSMKLLTTPERVQVIAELCRGGYGRQIVLSQDACGYVDVREPGYDEKTWPDWNFSHVATKVIPQLRAAGVSDMDIELMTRGNPRTIFERSLAPR